MSEGMFEIQYKPGEELVIRVRQPKLGDGGHEVFSHLVAANRELMLAFRSLVDAAIKSTEEAPKTEGARKKIKVE